MANTLEEYNAELARCRDTFIAKSGDYGPSWRILRPTTLTDQMLIKARRIRTLETEGEGNAMVDEGIAPEFAALVNYGLMALVQLTLPPVTAVDLTADEALARYDAAAGETRRLMLAKNHDYGEAWRQMRCSSITDIILTKLLRIKEIENNGGHTAVSEGVGSNYADIVNYALFALILL